MGKAKLVEKRALFVREYLKDFNGAQAAIRAGYSKKTARAIACKLLTFADVQAAIASAQEKRAERLDITVDRVVQEYAKIAFSKISDYLSFGPKGVKLKDSLGMSDSALAAVLEVSERAATEFDTRSISFKLHSKTSALEAVGRHLGMFNDKIELKVQGAVEELLDSVKGRMSPEAHAEFRKALAEEMGFEGVAPAEPVGSEGAVKH
jgi:phage terminase small subunit